MNKENFYWFKLDNAAKIFPGQNSRSWSNVFRICFHMKEKIDPQKLQKALKLTLLRMPSFNVKMKNGFFWHYLETNPNEPFVMKDIKNPCYRIKFKENKGFLFRVYYHEDRINVDFYHSLCDGYGAVFFVSTLACEYLKQMGHDVSCGGFALDVNDKPQQKELEDAYQKYACSKVKYKRGSDWMYHAKGTKLPMHMSNFTTGIMSFKQIHALAKSYGVTITEFFAALMIDVHYRKQLKENKKQKQISIQIPVNLRKAFPSETLRNFVLCLWVQINPNLGEYTFEEILRTVSLQLKLANDPKTINSLMTQNMKLERHPVMKYLPVAIKDLGIAIGFSITAEQTTSALISNIGPVKVPDDMAQHIEKCILFTGAGKVNGARCGVLTFGDKLCFNFSNCYEESDIEREFFTRLVKMGVHVAIESNRD